PCSPRPLPSLCAEGREEGGPLAPAEEELAPLPVPRIAEAHPAGGRGGLDAPALVLVAAERRPPPAPVAQSARMRLLPRAVPARCGRRPGPFPGLLAELRRISVHRDLSAVYGGNAPRYAGYGRWAHSPHGEIPDWAPVGVVIPGSFISMSTDPGQFPYALWRSR